MKNCCFESVLHALFCFLSDQTLSGCSSPLGMESQVISDSQITAFTSRSYDSSAKFARLNLGGWAPAGPSHREWLQVDLGTYSTVTSVATQGIKLYPERHKWYKPEFWTTSYNLQYSDDGIAFRFYKEPGKTLPKVYTESNLNTHGLSMIM